jgi:hypothetical protein
MYFFKAAVSMDLFLNRQIMRTSSSTHSTIWSVLQTLNRLINNSRIYLIH